MILVFDENVLEKEKYIWILSLNLNIVFYILGVSYLNNWGKIRLVYLFIFFVR